MNLTQLKKHKSFSGYTCFYSHESKVTQTTMKFSSHFGQSDLKASHCIIWLSGLTCTEENFITKAGAQKYFENTDAMILCPDTSPRGLNLPQEHDSYDFGSGAGFYLNATTSGYKDHYRMYDYVVNELTTLAKENFGVKTFSIMGHSMGGHGALVIGLREQSLFTKVSAFSPIVNPVNTSWGDRAFKGYLKDVKDWNNYDATELLKQGHKRNDLVLIEQGLSDEFLENNLKTNNFVEAAKKVNQKCQVNYREGYDHSYYFVSTFIKDHIEFHLS